VCCSGSKRPLQGWSAGSIPATRSVTYEPFLRGPFPVGTRSGVIVDERRQRRLPFEVWHPTVGGPRGDELPDAGVRAGHYPLVLYSHASGGTRRQSSFLCAHLASHGYVVAGVDHLGNSAADVAARAAAGTRSTPDEVDVLVRQFIADRVPDLRFLIDEVLSGGAGHLEDHVDPDRIGLVGWSFGGWAVLAMPEVEGRVRAVVALAPAGASNPLPGIIPAKLTFAWTREVPTLYLAAERDRFILLPGVRELYERTPSAKRMFVLRGADHGHFADRVDPVAERTPESAHLFTRGLALAHFDAVLKGDPGARRFLDGDVLAELKARGVDATA
jgi:dienelactone hydrolase